MTSEAASATLAKAIRRSQVETGIRANRSYTVDRARYGRRMAATAPKAFEEFKARLTLTANQRDALRQRREVIKDYLDEDWSIDTIMFGGSHARGSKIRPALGRQGDVDIYVVLDGRHKRYGGVFQAPPAKLLTDIKATLNRHLRTPKVRADSPAVRVTYNDMIVDVVPAFRHYFGDAFDIPYYKTWMTATPRGQQRVFKNLDDERNGHFKPLLRMSKHWKAIHPSIGLRSFHLETLGYEIFSRGEPIDDYRIALNTFFTRAAEFVQYPWNDPGGSGHRVTDYLTPAAKNKATVLFRSAALRAAKAIEAPTWRTEIAMWRSPFLLGARFPAWTET